MTHKEDIIVERYRMERSGEGTLVQTLGGLYIPDTKFKCVTLERPWMDNKQNVSCIPPAPQEEAIYEWVMLNDSPSFNYAHLWIKNVPNRTWIKIHAGNFYDQIQGCLLVGDGFEYVNSDDYLDCVNSRPTLAKLCKTLKEEKGITKGTIRIISKV